MNTRELIEAAKTKKFTIHEIDEQRKRILEADKKFEQESKEREVTIEFMNRVYSL